MFQRAVFIVGRLLHNLTIYTAFMVRLSLIGWIVRFIMWHTTKSPLDWRICTQHPAFNPSVQYEQRIWQAYTSYLWVQPINITVLERYAVSCFRPISILLYPIVSEQYLYKARSIRKQTAFVNKISMYASTNKKVNTYQVDKAVYNQYSR